MTLKGETLATGAPQVCLDCGIHVSLDVYKSAAGYYIGSYCDCGPYSRESEYFRTEEAALAAFRSGMYGTYTKEP